MCRMAISIGNVNMTALIDGVITMARDLSSQHELNKQEGPGSWTHDDGWGIAYLHEGKWHITRSTTTIYDDPSVNELRAKKAEIAIIHVRKKMGSEKAIHNTHPFFHERAKRKPVMFCHNGFIDEEIMHDEMYRPVGKTDSEKLFFSLLSDLKRDNLVKAIRKNFKRYEKLTGTNIILATEDQSVIAIRKNKFPQYYKMQLAQTEDTIIISSEALQNMPYVTWQPLEQGDVIQIKNKKLKLKIHAKKLPESKSVQKAAQHIYNSPPLEVQT